MKMRFGLAVGVATLLGATAALAIPIFDVNFNNDTIGDPPSTSATPVSDVYVRPTSITGATGANRGTTIRVESSFAAGSASLSDQPMVIKYQPDAGSPNDSFNVSFSANASYVDATSPFLLSFDFIIASADASAHNHFDVQILGGTTLNTSTNIGRFVFLANGGVLVISGDDWNEGTTATFNSAWSHDMLHAASFLVTPSDRTIELFIDGGSKGQHTIEATVPNGNLGVQRLNLVQGSTGGTWTGAFDNFATAIPEPGTAGLFLAAAGLLGLRALRRRGR